MRLYQPLLALNFLLACGGGATDPNGTNEPIDGTPNDPIINTEDPNRTEDPPPVDMPPLAEGVSTLAGYSAPGDTDGPRGRAFFDNPVNVLQVGDLVYVADFYNGRVATITADGVVSTVIRADNFDRPFGMVALDSSTMLIQTDRTTIGGQDGALWRFDIASKTTTLIAESVGRPRSMVTMADGTVVVADYQRHYIGVLNTQTGAITPLAGTPGESGYADGNGAAARFYEPLDMVALSGTEILVADRYNNCIRKVTLSGEVTTWAGSSEGGYTDGARDAARFSEPLSLAKAPNGTIYVGDGANYRVRMIAADGSVSTMAGNGEGGYKDDSQPMNAQFMGMEGIDISADGKYLFVADGARGLYEPFNRVRRITLQ